jgi:hypothetical protein
MSALPPKQTLVERVGVRVAPKADKVLRSKIPLFDEFVGIHQQ